MRTNVFNKSLKTLTPANIRDLVVVGEVVVEVEVEDVVGVEVDDEVEVEVVVELIYY